jgi:NAD-dependent SIR2 family protein deacetylase
MVTPKMMISAVRALWKYVVWRKCKKVVWNVMNRRLYKCYHCPKMEHTILSRWYSFGVRCSVCGCFIRLKVWCIDEKCPVGKW